MKSIEAQHGLLVERARGIYSFSHLTFHEYFTARRIEKREDLYPILISHLTEQRWREVILLTAGMVEEADSLLLRMKSSIDGILANDEKLQEFLAWVDRKARSMNTPYKPAAFRAFYLSLSLPLQLEFTIPIDRSNFNNSLARNLSEVLELALALDSSLYSNFISEHTLVAILNASDIYQFTFSLDDVDWDTPLLMTHFQDAIRGISFGLDRFLNSSINSEINFIINKLKESLPGYDKKRDYIQCWWLKNGLDWTRKLRAISVEYYDVGHEWKFTHTQDELLQQYQDANKLLVDCLNSNCYVSRPVREKIEASLLLPMAELQQQFPNQCHSL